MLVPNGFLSVLYDNAVGAFSGRRAVDGVGACLVGCGRCSCGLTDACGLTGFYLIFLLGFLHLCDELFAALKGAETYAGCRTAGIHIALPVGTHDDTACAEVPSALEDFVGALGGNLCKEQCGAPAAQRVP